MSTHTDPNTAPLALLRAVRATIEQADRPAYLNTVAGLPDPNEARVKVTTGAKRRAAMADHLRSAGYTVQETPLGALMVTRAAERVRVGRPYNVAPHDLLAAARADGRLPAVGSPEPRMSAFDLPTAGDVARFVDAPMVPESTPNLTGAERARITAATLRGADSPTMAAMAPLMDAPRARCPWRRIYALGAAWSATLVGAVAITAHSVL